MDLLLGLICGFTIDGAAVGVRMTLTTPGCPMQERIARGVQNALLSLDAIKAVRVEVVRDPPWNPARMSAFARARLGVA